LDLTSVGYGKETLFGSDTVRAAFGRAGNHGVRAIATVRTASIGSTVTVRGIVTNGSELGSIRYVQDGTAGIALYGSNLSSLQRGDSVVATGPLTSYNNLLEVTPVNSFTDLGPQTLPAFQTITVPQMNETTEGELVRFDNCTFALGGGTFAGNTNLQCHFRRTNAASSDCQHESACGNGDSRRRRAPDWNCFAVLFQSYIRLHDRLSAPASGCQ
jgi:hypothetical protein